MKTSCRFVVIFALALLPLVDSDLSAGNGSDALAPEELRALVLSSPCVGDSDFHRVQRHADQILEECFRILSAIETPNNEIAAALEKVRYLRGSRDRFAPNIARFAFSKDSDVRRTWMTAIGGIGNDTDDLALIILLGDFSYPDFSATAADSIIRIGGLRSLDALEIWWSVRGSWEPTQITDFQQRAIVALRERLRTRERFERVRHAGASLVEELLSPDFLRKRSKCTADIRRVLSADRESTSARKSLIAEGERHFRYYEDILREGGLPTREAVRLWSILAETTGDRARFIPHAARHLTDASPEVRAAVVGALAGFGDRTASPLIAATMSDTSEAVVLAAAEALSRLEPGRVRYLLSVWVVVQEQNLRVEGGEMHQYSQKLIDRIKSIRDRSRR